MFLRMALRSLAAVVVASVGLVLGVATSLASEPMPESAGRSGIWPPVPAPLARSVLGSDGLGDWVFGAALLVVAMAMLAFRRSDGASPE
jgi:hypothetical protein